MSAKHLSPDGISRPCRPSKTGKCKWRQLTADEHNALQIMGAKDYADAVAKLALYQAHLATKPTITAKQKTAYRETGAVFGIKGTPGLNVVLAMSSEEYIASVKANQPELRAGELRALEGLSWERGFIPKELESTLVRNYQLGKNIRKFYYKNGYEGSLHDVRWVGDDTSVAPADVTINGDLWSLKEDSDIIKNGGSSILMNTLTSTETYGRGFHMLNAYAPNENTEALQYTVNEYNKSLPANAQLKVPSSYDDWNANFSATERKNLARWVRDQDSSSNFAKEFSVHKDRINKAAGERLIQEVKGKSPSGGTLLAIDKSYYYGKIKGNSLHVGYIPSAKELDERVKVTNVEYRSGKQLDIIISYQNERGETLQTVNEIRYSHGQFFGVPEAKMKILTGDFTKFVAP